MKEQIEICIRSYVMGDMTLAQCIDEIYMLYIRNWSNKAFILFMIIAALIAILAATLIL